MNRLKSEILSSAVSSLHMSEDGVGTRRYCFGPEFIGFEGHFPGFPILPAVVQILCGIVVAEEIKGALLEPTNIHKAKFLLKVKPGQEIEVQCREKSIQDQNGFEVRLNTDEGLASSFSMAYALKDSKK